MAGIGGELRATAQAVGAVFRDRDLRLMEIARASALLGTTGSTILFVVIAYRLGGAGGVGALAVIRLVVTTVAAPFGSLLGDRYDRRLVIATADAVRVVCLGATAAAAAWTSSLALELALGAAITAIGLVSAPARAAMLPGLAGTPERLTAANVVASAIDDLSSLLGPALAGAALALTGISAAFAASAAVAAVAPFVAAMIRTPAREEPPPEKEQSKRRELLAGFHALWDAESARTLVLVYAVIAFVGGAMTILVSVTAIRLLGIGSSGVGFLYTFFSGGALIGTALSMLLIRRGLENAVFGGTLAWGLPFVAVGVWPRPALAFSLFVVAGAGDTVAFIAAVTLLQRVISDDVLSRSFGALQFVLGGMAVLGSAAAPLVVSLLGVRGALLAFGAIIPLAAAPAALRLRGRVGAPGALRVLREVPFLALLAEPTLEQLAAGARRLELPAGTAVFSEGDAGDRFYVVADGSVEIASNGRTLAIEEPGGAFGEIALLRDVPRTATATARSRTELYALDRADFLGALTGEAQARGEAEALVSRRLGAGA